MGQLSPAGEEGEEVQAEGTGTLEAGCLCLELSAPPCGAGQEPSPLRAGPSSSVSGRQGTPIS